MNNISDITILVAVLALALWPAIIVYLSWRREKKIISCLKNETPATETPKLSTEELIVSTLKKMGCNPEKNEEGNIGFMYQGDDFYLSFQEDVPFVMIWYPWWGTINADNPVLPYLKEVINAVNISSFITTVFMAENEGDKARTAIHSSQKMDLNRKNILSLFLTVSSTPETQSRRILTNLVPQFRKRTRGQRKKELL